MKVEEIKLAFNTNIQLNIVSILKTDLGKGDAFIVNGRKSMQNVIDGYNSAISVYTSIVSQADKYIDMAKAMGETGIQKSLEDTKKEANDMIKLSNAAITKLKSI